MLLILRENHIKAKYQSKTWVIPHSSPRFTELSPVELKILNDRGPGFRRDRLEATCSGLFEAQRTPMDFIVSRAISEPATPEKPCVRLPPEQSTKASHETFDFRTENAYHTLDTTSRTTGSVSEDMPGQKWMEEWIEKKGAHSASNSPSRINLEDRVVNGQQRFATAPDRGQLQPNAQQASLKAKTRYKVNIPQQYAKQTDKIPKDFTRRHARYVSDGSSASSENSGPKFGRARDSRPDRSEATDFQHYQNPLDYETFHHVPVILNPPALSSRRYSSTWSAATTLQDPYVTRLPVQSFQSTQNGHHQRYYACYEWNYYLPCLSASPTNCSKPHMCELCSSSEHRAAQHWHHLATAPLPEIQPHPRLSSYSPQPESPTLAALKHRIPLFVPSPELQHSPIFKTTKAEDLSLSPLRLDQSQERAIRPANLSPKKTLPLGEVSGSETSSGSRTGEEGLSSSPSSGFESSVEVILAPLSRPFQRREPSNETETTKASRQTETKLSVGGLSVHAPVFEPSYLGAWVPFKGITGQFDSLFKIPSRESRKIKIVAPPNNKGKEPAREVKSVKSAKQVRLSESTSKSALPKGERSVKKVQSRSVWADGVGSDGDAPLSDDNILASTLHLGEENGYQAAVRDTLQQTSLANVISSARQSPNLDRYILQMLDEQLEAIIGQESEETVAATLETIMEICSTSSTSTTPSILDSKRSNFPNVSGIRSRNISGTHSLINIGSPPSPSQFASTSFSLGDFADDDTFFPSLFFSQTDERPRSSDSTSTAPLAPNSPRTPNRSVLDHSPLQSRIERMMSCAASRGHGTCNCGLGDWFHHSPRS